MSAVKAPRPPILKKEGTLQRPLKVRLELTATPQIPHTPHT